MVHPKQSTSPPRPLRILEAPIMIFDADEEPLTPASRFFTQPNIQQVINVVCGAANPIKMDALKRELEGTFVRCYPRFSSILVRGRGGKECWRRVEHVDVDKHVFEIQDEGGEGKEPDADFVNEYMASLSTSTPLDFGKPLWEVHVLPRHRCYIIRLHHALGDGISLMSLFLSGCRRVDDPRLLPTIPAARTEGKNAKAARGSTGKKLWRLLLVVWYTVVYSVDFMLHCLWVRDEITPISGGEGVEMWPRKLEIATFELGDMRVVKDAVGATINDVLMGVVARGLEKYLELRSPERRKPPHISGLALVNTRQQPGLQEISNMMRHQSKARWGNQIGYVILPIHLQRSTGDSLDYVRRAKALMEKKKLSLEAHFSYACGAIIMSLLGPKVATSTNYRIMSNTTFTISNVVGPSEEISFAGNPITTIRVTATSLPHAITMHMLSYKGKANLQILVARDIIPDSEILRRCFEDALEDMKNEALLGAKKKA